jgi:hypothetical protein
VAVINSRQVFIASALAGLILADLAVDVGVIWGIEESRSYYDWAEQICTGFLLGQLMLVGLWFGLGDGQWHVRLGAAVVLTFGLVKAVWIAGMLRTSAPDPDYPAIVVFVLLPLMLTAGWAGFVLRRMWSWRLTWQPIEGVSAKRQFQLGDAMLWMVVVAAALASMRFVVTLDQNFPEQFLEIAVWTALTTLAVLVSMTGSFGTGHWGRTILVTTSAVLLIGLAFSVPAAYTSARQIRGMNQMPTPTIDYVVAGAKEAGEHVVCAIAAALSTVMNCVALRALGCRLVRPGVRL